jgi:hypothetical protein
LVLGELEEFHPWIYALAGGMFVYIGLADMVDSYFSYLCYFFA